MNECSGHPAIKERGMDDLVRRCAHLDGVGYAVQVGETVPGMAIVIRGNEMWLGVPDDDETPESVWEQANAVLFGHRPDFYWSDEATP